MLQWYPLLRRSKSSAASSIVGLVLCAKNTKLNKFPNRNLPHFLHFSRLIDLSPAKKSLLCIFSIWPWNWLLAHLCRLSSSTNISIICWSPSQELECWNCKHLPLWMCSIQIRTLCEKHNNWQKIESGFCWRNQNLNQDSLA